MLLVNVNPFPTDFPSLGQYGIAPGAEFEVPDAEAEGLLAQGYEPAGGLPDAEPDQTPEEA